MTKISAQSCALSAISRTTPDTTYDIKNSEKTVPVLDKYLPNGYVENAAAAAHL